jgi:hypothetical protein
MASKKKFEGLEVEVTAPRMGRLERAEYDYAARQGLTLEQYRKKQEDMVDMAMGFSGPMAISKIDLRKMSKLKRLGQDFATRASSGADNVAVAATKDEEKKYARGGRIDGIAKRGKTKGRMR